MTRTKLASYCLLASAFVLGAMLMIQVAGYVENEARADMVTTARSVSILSARTDNGELLAILDSRNEMLMGYLLDASRREFKLMDALNVREVLSRGGGGSSRGGRSPR